MVNQCLQKVPWHLFRIRNQHWANAYTIRVSDGLKWRLAVEVLLIVRRMWRAERVLQTTINYPCSHFQSSYLSSWICIFIWQQLNKWQNAGNAADISLFCHDAQCVCLLVILTARWCMAASPDCILIVAYREGSQVKERWGLLEASLTRRRLIQHVTDDSARLGDCKSPPALPVAQFILSSPTHAA